MKAGVDYIGITTPFCCYDGAGKFLLHKRSQNTRDEQGAWDCGGGQLEFGEQPEEGALREVREEYGCEGKILERVAPLSVFRELNGIKTHWLAIPFIIQVDPKEVRNNEPHAIDKLGWFSFDDLPQPLHVGFQMWSTARKEVFAKYLSPGVKRLKFSPDLVPLILTGKKTSTWRLFDDKNIQSGDTIECLEKGNEKKPFAIIRVVKVREKMFKDLSPNDWEGHEKFASDDEMYQTYATYYNQPIHPETVVKVIQFKALV